MSTRRLGRRELLGIGAMSAGALLMTACGAPATPTPAPQAAAPTKAPAPTAATQAAPAAKGQVTLRFLLRHYSSYGHVWDRVIEAHEKNNPNVKVEKIINPGTDCGETKLLTMVGGGDVPDLYWTCEYWVAFIKKGLFKKLNPFMMSDKAFSVEEYEPVWIDMYKQPDGGIYGLPWDAFTFMLFYNKDMFDKEKVPYPDPEKPMTWEELLELAKRMTKWDGPRPQQLGANITGWSMWWVWLSQIGIPLFNQDMSGINYDTPEAHKTLDWFAEWQHKHKVHPSAMFQTDLPLDFPSGKLATWVAAVPQWTYTRRDAKFKWDVAPYPQTANTKRQTFGFMVTINMLEKSAHPDEAWGFIKTASGPDHYPILYSQGMSMPTRKAHIDPPHPEWVNSKPPDNNKVVLEDAKYLILPFRANNGAWQQVNQIISNAMSQVYVGKATAKEAMGQAAQECARVLKELKEAGNL